jgi:AraC-like DNA-binding protein
LKRRLKQRGLTFQDLLTSTRIDLARRQLSRGAPVTNVAADLGYSQVSAFSRAFRQWTGVSPREYLRRGGSI